MTTIILMKTIIFCPKTRTINTEIVKSFWHKSRYCYQKQACESYFLWFM